MGMAASQARLLSITARMHDVEFQAQSIQNAKLRLAIDEESAYREYNAALDATTLTINAINLTSGEKSTIPATFNNLCSRSRLTAADGKNYAILDNKGRLIVENDIEEAYNENNFANAYEFAIYMMNPDGNNNTYAFANNSAELGQKLNEAEEDVYNSLTPKSNKLTGLRDKLASLTGSDDIYNTDSVEEENKDEYEKTLAAYKHELYKRAAGKINEKLYTLNKETEYTSAEDFDTDLFNYYISIFNQIQQAGGCVSISEYDGMNGDAANDNEWLQAMIQSGQFTLEIIETDKKTGEVDLDATSVSSDSCVGYTQTTEIDKRAFAKAEAEYEHRLKQIDKKDKQYDLELSKLETERQALTTEYDSVKKVIQDNIDRTFKIFS